MVEGSKSKIFETMTWEIPLYQERFYSAFETNISCILLSENAVLVDCVSKYAILILRPLGGGVQYC